MKTALITGATSGIGREYAIQLAKEGYNLIITGRRQALLEEVAYYISQRYGVKVNLCIVDFINNLQRQNFIQYISEQEIDILVNNAGYGAEAKFSEDDYTNQEDMIKVHILTSTELMHVVLPHMKINSNGEIINVSSLAGFLKLPGSEMYCATKSYLTSFSLSLALEVEKYNIRVQALCPGFVHTDFHKKLGYDLAKCRDIGPVRWMDTDTVVKTSRQYIKKNTPLCIPGMSNQLFYHLLHVIPFSAYSEVLRTIYNKFYN